MKAGRKTLLVILAVAALAVGIVSGVQVVMAVRYSEWGRVIVYGTLAVFCVELFIWSLSEIKGKGAENP